MVERNGKKKGKAVPKRKEEKKCCDKPKGEEKLLPSVGVLFLGFFPKNLDTTVKLSQGHSTDQFVWMKWVPL